MFSTNFAKAAGHSAPSLLRSTPYSMFLIHRMQYSQYHFRSLLFIPGNSEKMLSKMYTMENKPDVFVPDLEDSVSYSKKDEARQIMSSFLKKNGKPGNSVLIPRVNSEEEFFENDLRSLMQLNSEFGKQASGINASVKDQMQLIYAITVGKTQDSQDVERYHRMICSIEEEYNLPKNGVKLIPTIESAMAIMNLKEIAFTCRDRVIGLAFGADDYAHDMGFTRDTQPQINGECESEEELSFARHSLAVAARAAGIQSFDTPNVNFKHPDAHLREARAVRRMGFTGKFAIHPLQIKEIHEVFGVTKEEYEYALRVVHAYNESVAVNARGSLQIDGRMIDQPVLKQYKRVIEAYERSKSS